MYEYDYEVRRGETFDKCFYVVDTDDKPIDLTGMKVMGQIRPTKEDRVLTASFRCSIDFATACVRYMLSAADTKNIACGNYEYDVALYEDVGSERVVYYYIGGKFTVQKAVTNALA
ncbi:MAG: hypothetical protein IJI45_05340 [Anaerolineaceae bacterium]|nr:hypothetical protein [Anaerolineaceae bacterium]